MKDYVTLEPMRGCDELDRTLDEDVLDKAAASDLSDEQQRIVEKILDGHNMCVTGNAGTGKTYLLNWLRAHIPMSVTASTGIAALHVNGITIHAWAGLGIGEKTAHEIVENLTERAERWGDTTLQNIQSAERLVIDEVSMLGGEIISLLDGVLQVARNDDLPFGGLQIIFFGDFLQLPPVTRGSRRPVFAFQTAQWEEARISTRILTKVFRQKDQAFADVLHKIRLGVTDDEVGDFLMSRSDAVDDNPELAPCILHSHNKKCQQINSKQLTDLPGDVIELEASEEGKPLFMKSLEKNCLAPKLLELKIGARVMLLKNEDLQRGLVNGSMGHVVHANRLEVSVEFDNGITTKIDKHRFEWKSGSGAVMATRVQYPLRLAYAITIHKSQGMTLDKVAAHLERCFADGQSYVALSRAKTAEGLFLMGSGCEITANEEAVKFYQSIGL